MNCLCGILSNIHWKDFQCVRKFRLVIIPYNDSNTIGTKTFTESWNTAILSSFTQICLRLNMALFIKLFVYVWVIQTRCICYFYLIDKTTSKEKGVCLQSNFLCKTSVSYSEAKLCEVLRQQVLVIKRDE